ncbi:hypothetical protein HF086_016231 [Spodoptera exigua]|uniref:Peptidase A2 domain-containing protein n=2 Tax=Spodoptera exigua TaxID=7107 RepID=A0A922MIS0_SPOEX|nr:hypothetical protein HF086_016231 [Spodoptera exigua]
MSSYDALLDSQSDNLNAIKRINENFKKDSPTRKTTLEYHDERLQKLEEYWSDFKNNDIQLALFEGKKSGPYYENRVYERLEQIYEETKSMINKSKQRLLAKIEDDKFTSFTQLQQQEERSSAQEVVKEQREREEVTYDVKNTTSNEELVVDQRTKDMLNEQRSNIKAFERTIRNMDIENLKEKWQLEDKLSWDPLVVHILMQKLDADTCQSFKESMEKPKEMPSLNELLKFIETKFMSMESGANPNRPRNSNSQQQNTQPKTVHNATYSKPKAQQQTSPGGAKNMPRTYHNKQTSHHSFITCPKCNKQHGLYNCREFLSMSPDERLKTANNLHVCLNCLFSHNGEKMHVGKRCKHCDESHSSILHDAIGLAKSKTNRVNVGQQVNTHLAHDNSNEVLLATAQVKTIANDGTIVILRALLDQGSQVSIITENAAQKLQLKRERMSAVVSGVGASATTNCKGVLHLKCQAIYNNFNININAFIMKKITNKLPSKTINKDSFEHLQHLQLADPDFNISQNIDLLLGAEVYSEILLEGLLKTNTSSVIAQQTHLGWIVCGNYKTFNCHVIVNNIQDLAQFWEQESLQEEKEDFDPDNKCEQLYKETTTRLPDGRYQVRLPSRTILLNN